MGESQLPEAKESYTIGDIGANTRVQQGKNQTWIEAANTIDESNTLKQQFEKILEEISQDNSLDEVEKCISKEKTEAISKGLENAQNSPKDLQYALIDSKSWFSSKASGVWNKLNDILKSDAAQKTIGTIAESGVKGAIQALIR